MNVPELGRLIVRVGADGMGRVIARPAAAVPALSAVPGRGADLDGPDAVLLTVTAPEAARKTLL